MVGAIINSLRPRQWVKNLLVFAGLIFSRSLLVTEAVLRSLGGFAVFCLLSGAVYVVNDLADVIQDRNHPTKRFRPIASGQLSAGTAKLAAIIVFVVALLGAWLLGWRFAMVAIAYLVLQLAYSAWLKHVVILDVMAVAVGFALRAVAGTVAIGVTISPWLFICTILGALFVALAKRRHELLFLESGGTSHREVLGKYSEGLLDQMIAMATSSTVITYSLYTVAPETVAKFATHNLILTVPFVIFGVYRYLYLVYRKEMGGAPEKALLTDVPLLVGGLLWVATAVAVLYVRF